jgi:methionyl-tRNA synthetase
MNAASLTALEGIGATTGLSGGLFWVLVIALAAWTFAIKGYALWHAARNYQRRWFIALLIINTFGLLELVYLVWFRADKDENRTPSLFNTPEGPAQPASA